MTGAQTVISALIVLGIVAILHGQEQQTALLQKIAANPTQPVKADAVITDVDVKALYRVFRTVREMDRMSKAKPGTTGSLPLCDSDLGKASVSCWSGPKGENARY